MSDPTSETTLPPGPRMVMGNDEDLATALRRMALEQAHVVVGGFALVKDDALLDHSLHIARKAGKRLRGLLRLCRYELGRDGYRWANTLVRDQGRLLSEVRTSAVLVHTLDGLVEGGMLSPEDAAPLRDVLTQRHARALTDLRSDSGGRTGAQRELLGLIGRITDFPTPAAYEERDLAALERAVRRSYRRARRAMRTAIREDTAHAFHEWRKGTNYVRYQMEALSGACGPLIAELVVSLELLSEVLGDDHDLADFLDTIDSGHVVMPPGLHEVIDERSRLLRERAVSLGLQIFAEKPKGFARFFTAQSRPHPRGAAAQEAKR